MPTLFLQTLQPFNTLSCQHYSRHSSHSTHCHANIIQDNPTIQNTVMPTLFQTLQTFNTLSYQHYSSRHSSHSTLCHANIISDTPFNTLSCQHYSRHSTLCHANTIPDTPDIQHSVLPTLLETPQTFNTLPCQHYSRHSSRSTLSCQHYSRYSRRSALCHANITPDNPIMEWCWHFVITMDYDYNNYIFFMTITMIVSWWY